MYKLYHEALGASANRALYAFALSRHERFTRSRTTAGSAKYTDWRKSTVIYDDQIGEASTRLDQLVRHNLPEVLDHLKMGAFEIGHLEMQLTSHNDGEYYHWHSDNGMPETAGRTVTFVYYFHGLPKRFTGGELVIYGDDGEKAVIEPANDTLIFFPSRTRHEVRVINCPSRRFGDGRFTLNGWVHRRPLPLRGDYFDRKIFGPWRRPASLYARGEAGGGRARATSPQPRAATAAPGPELGELAIALLNLYSDLHRQSGEPPRVATLTKIDGAAFFRDYYFANRPVHVQGALGTSPAVRNWSLDFFEKTYGAVEVPITTGRSRDPEYEVNFPQSVRTMALGEFVRRLREEQESNDFYIVARNQFFDREPLRPLRREIAPPADIINTDDESPGTAKMWFGPKGTVTPLHYDRHSILFAQILGRKHFKLIPPFDGPKVYVRNCYYSAVDPLNVGAARHPAFLKARVMDVIVEPGDLLFLPAGWWHWAKSLDVSMSATFSSFRIENRNTALTIKAS